MRTPLHLTRRIAGRAIALACVAAALPAAGAHAEHDHHGEAGAAAFTPVCATTPVGLGATSDAATTVSAARAGAREPSAWLAPQIEEAPSSGKKFRASIPVRFHVFTDGAKGRVSEDRLQQQVAVLNTTFGGGEGGGDTGFSFTYAGVDYTDNATWFHELDLGTKVAREAKAATHVGGADTLNVWTTAGRSYLGFATFPSKYKTAPELDGIVLDHESLPGGAYGSSYSLGETGTHEVGHWLGLLHTFQGACNNKGDWVADTPAMSVPTSGCPEGKDTCPAPGDDPVRNYMDYSFDSCYTSFTADQAQRMRDQWAFFRASGGAATGV